MTEQQDPGGVVPPYDERKDTASDDPGPEAVRRDGAYVSGATAPTTSDEGLTSPDPSDTPGGRTTSPSDEMPAEEMPAESTGTGRPTEDPGVGPAHVAGAGRGEDKADNEKG